MSNDELSLFSYEILGLVGREGASAHDLRRLAERDRILAWAGESQYYVEPKRLARLGYLEARKAPGKTRERTVYTLTDQGREAIRAYARTPARFTPVKSEPLVRLLLADLGGAAATRASLGALRGGARRARGAGRRRGRARGGAAAPPPQPPAGQRVPAPAHRPLPRPDRRGRERPGAGVACGHVRRRDPGADRGAARAPARGGGAGAALRARGGRAHRTSGAPTRPRTSRRSSPSARNPRNG